MPEGPFGGPRPFSKYELVIDPHNNTAELEKVGPFGGPRPFAKDNPPVSDERVAECILSEAGRSFGAGVVSSGQTTDLSELPPEARQRALEVTEEWCRGSLEAQAIEEMERDEAIPALTRIRKTLSKETGDDDRVRIPLEGDIDAEEL